MNRLSILTAKSSVLKNMRNILGQANNRKFLTESYYCYDKWDQYLQSNVIKNVGMVNTYSALLDEKLRNQKLVTPFDMDLLAAKIVFINNYQELEFIENIFLNFRKTQAALYVRDSMHYSFARSYLDLNQTDKLLQILKLKYNYGLFLDSFTATMLMDSFVKENDYVRAALAAHEVMLQELNENELTLTACLYSCYMHLTEQRDTNINAASSENQDEKPTKQLVYFLRKAYNDEHFDLESLTRLSGKTILFALKYLELSNPVLANSLRIFGYLLFEKYEKGVDFLERLIVKENGQLSDVLLNEFKLAHDKVTQNETEAKLHENFINKWNNLKTLCESEAKTRFVKIDIKNELKKLLEESANKNMSSQMENQISLFEKWSKEQETELDQQTKNIQKDAKRENLLERIDELEKQQEILTYFDKKQQILNSYTEKGGFLEENPADIPIEPDQTQFNEKSERHFKPWPKYANRPPESQAVSEERREVLESLKRIYLNNARAQNK